MQGKKEMNRKRRGFAIAYDDLRNDIYVFGGVDKTYFNHCEKYSIAKNQWMEIAPMANEKRDA